MFRVIALVKPTGMGFFRARVLGCVLLLAACGGRADSTLLQIPCDEGMVCESRDETKSEQQDEAPATQVGEHENQPDATMNANGQDPRQTEAGETCPGAVDVARAYLRETLAPGPSMPSFDEEGQLIVSELVIGPCSQCISKCSPMPVQGCSIQDACVQRHCDCSTTGCENGIPTGDFCLCAATCMGAGQESCLESWVPYGQCLATCASVCT